MSEHNNSFYNHSKNTRKSERPAYIDPKSFDEWLPPEPVMPKPVQKSEPIPAPQPPVEEKTASPQQIPQKEEPKVAATAPDFGKKIIAFSAAAVIVIFSFWLIVRPKAEYSQQENRYLEKWPKFTFSALVDGSYLSNIDDYLADHFPMRDFFVNINTQFSLILGKKEINDVFIAKDDYLIEKYAQPTRTELIIRAFNRLEENVTGGDVALMLIPTAITVYEEKLPYGVNVPSQMEELNTIYAAYNGKTVDVASKLMEQKENYQIFFRTDHHWTTYGAYFGYVALCETLGIRAEELSDYNATTVTDDFCGTIYSKVNDYTRDGDSIVLFEHPDWQDITVTYEDTGVVADSPYDLSYVDEKDKYSLFLSNIHPLVVINNPHSQGRESIAIVKDSYANSLVPFLINHYRNIYIFDTRYYQGDVSEFINAHSDITQTVIVYNMNTMDTDTGTTKIR